MKMGEFLLQGVELKPRSKQLAECFLGHMFSELQLMDWSCSSQVLLLRLIAEIVLIRI